jgi:hypothetical protein
MEKRKSLFMCYPSDRFQYFAGRLKNYNLSIVGFIGRGIETGFAVFHRAAEVLWGLLTAQANAPPHDTTSH